MISFKKAVYLLSCTDPDELPYSKFPEIAVVGRSNVGKSSLINFLVQTKDLARVSPTPGKTQKLNYFLVDDRLTLVDLPGYGFAEAPEELKNNWAELIDGYLSKAKALKLILFLLDARRLPSKEDRQFLAWAKHHKKSVLLVLTKIDKLEKQELCDNISRILELLDAFDVPYVQTSATKKWGRPELIENINEKLCL